MAYLNLPTGNKIIDEDGDFNQGWSQSLSILNSALEGEYNKNKCTTSSTAVTRNSFSPLNSVLYIKYAEDIASDTLTFPFKLWGALEVRDNNGSVTQTKHLDGINEITITNIVAGEFITGTLTTGR